MAMANVNQLLGYAIIGLGLALAILAFRLLQSEQKQRIPRQSMLAAIYVFTAFSLLLAAAGIFAEIKRTQSEASRTQSPEPWARPGAWTAEDFFGRAPSNTRDDSGRIGAGRFHERRDGDPTRRAIFERLCREGEQTVGALTARSGVSQPAVSKHLGVLKQACKMMGYSRDSF